MQLPQFISRAVAFFEKAETDFKAKEEVSNTRIVELEKQAAADKQTIAARDLTITGLEGKLAAALDDSKSKAEEIKVEQDKVETEKNRANETLATQGILAEDIPAGDAKAPGTQNKETPWEKYCRLQITNPREAGSFWASQGDEILKTRK